MQDLADFKDVQIEALQKELEKTKKALQDAKDLLQGVLNEIENLNN